jgi:oxygen-independent coproporphyrinogen-3 oxidase
MNRSHNAYQAHHCIENSYAAGIDNLSIDLIFGSPTTSLDNWKKNLELAQSYMIRHLSCYGLTIEKGTALHDFIAKGKVSPPNEGIALQQFQYAISYLTGKGYDHYEISNYCLPGFEAIHNSNYWKQAPYLGIGPSAHSFDGTSRQWNVSHNVKYIKALKSGQLATETEVLTPKDIFNEYLLTGLRTKWGCHSDHLRKIDAGYFNQFAGDASILVDQGLLIHTDETYYLTNKGKTIADSVISDLFITQ